MTRAGSILSRLAAVVLLTAISALAVRGGDDNPDDVKRMISDEAFADATYTSEAKLKTVRDMYDLSLDVEIQRIDRYCSLTNDQNAKLRLAGKGDFNRWLERAKEIKPKYVGKPLSFEEHRYANIEMSFLRLWPSDMSHDRDSLLQQTLRNIVTVEQEPGYATYRRSQRLKQLDRTWMNWTMGLGTQLTLSKTSREKVNDLLLEHAPPLPRNGEYRDLIVILQLEELKDLVQPVLTEDEWKQFQTALDRAHSMERYLRHFDLWPVRTVDETN